MKIMLSQMLETEYLKYITDEPNVQFSASALHFHRFMRVISFNFYVFLISFAVPMLKMKARQKEQYDDCRHDLIASLYAAR